MRLKTTSDHSSLVYLSGRASEEVRPGHYTDVQLEPGPYRMKIRDDEAGKAMPFDFDLDEGQVLEIVYSDVDEPRATVVR